MEDGTLELDAETLLKKTPLPKVGLFLGWKGWEVHEIWGLNHEGHVGGRLGPCWGPDGAILRSWAMWRPWWAMLRQCVGQVEGT